MKIIGNELRVGMIIEHEGKLYRVVDTQHVKPGKGGAYVQTELKEIKIGSKMNIRFRSDEAIEKIFLDQKNCQFTYSDTDRLYFMDTENYEEITLSKTDVDSEKLPYIQDGIVVDIDFYGEIPIGVTLPATVVLEVVETEMALKGQTATGSYKPAILSNGIKIGVPQYIEVGTKVIVNTAKGEFSSKAKE